MNELAELEDELSILVLGPLQQLRFDIRAILGCIVLCESDRQIPYLCGGLLLLAS